MRRTSRVNVASHPLFWVVILARIGAAIYILFNPLAGFILSLVFDYLDPLVLIHTLGVSRRMYYKIDKVLDWVSYAAMVVVSMKLGVSAILAPFVLWRLAGQCINWANDGWHEFLLFPNFIEPMFLWLILGRPGIWWLVALGIIQMVRKLFIYHVWPAYLRRNGYPPVLGIFGQTKKVRW